MKDEQKYAYESGLAAAERANKRLFIIVLILAAALILSNLGWVLYEQQFEIVEDVVTTEETYEYDVDQDNGSGDNNFIGRDGNITYGETAH